MSQTTTQKLTKYRQKSTLIMMNAIDAGTYPWSNVMYTKAEVNRVAHAGAWHKLLLDASGGAITNYTDPLNPGIHWKHNPPSYLDTKSKDLQIEMSPKMDGAKWHPVLIHRWKRH